MNNKTYCDECQFLEERPVFANGLRGIIMQTGTRFYCPIKNRWFPIGTTIEQVGFEYCDKGKKVNDIN